MSDKSNKNTNNQSGNKPNGNFDYRSGAQTPTFRKPTPPPPPKPKK